MNAFGCVGNTIPCDSGVYFDLAAPDPLTINIFDIAAGLSKACRFVGQCRKFYSVAEHCCHAVDIAVSDGLPAECVKAVFLHDAAEAYIGDVSKPLKLLLPDYQAIEQRVEAAIAACFQVDFDRWKNEIREIDQALLMAERRFLFPDDGVKWPGQDEVRRIDPYLIGFMPDSARTEFLRVWRKVNGGH